MQWMIMNLCVELLFQQSEKANEGNIAGIMQKKTMEPLPFMNKKKVTQRGRAQFEV